MSAVPQKALSLFDAVCLIVGVIIGAGIYETTPAVAGCMGGWSGVLFVWLAGGLLALCGALCYAELASTYPHQGGDYVYLTRAYGPWAGFMFGWSQMVIIRPGDIALLSYVFARYASTLYAPFPNPGAAYAALVVVVLTVINILGVRGGKWTQNILTVMKMAGLLCILGIAWLAPGVEEIPHPAGDPGGGLRLALILVLFTYGGWNEMAYVAAEIRHPQKNIPRALVLGTLVVMVLYLLINGVFLHALGFEGLAASDAGAVDAVAVVLPGAAARLIGVIICISALGAVNGLIFSGARISYAMGTGHRIFQVMGRWSPGLGTPVAALVLQGAISLGIILLAGSFIDAILYSAPAVWLFFLASGLALFRLRKRDAGRTRRYEVAGYPLIPMLFCAAAAFMTCNAATFAWSQKPAGFAVLGALLLAGAAVYAIPASRGR